MRPPAQLPRARLAAVLVIGASIAVAAATASSKATPDRTFSSASLRTCVWRAGPSADPHRIWYDRFNSVAGVSPREAWAVGDSYTGRENGGRGSFIERWDGRRWRLAPAPIPPGATLWSVSASQVGDVWAVGQRRTGSGLIMHWDGARWRVVPAPNRGLLSAVFARTPRDVWAVGTRNRGGGSKTLIEHWNGRRWTVVPSPNPTAAHGRRQFASLESVTAISPTDVWAAGTTVIGVPAAGSRTLIEHWDGRRWTIVPSPNVRSARGFVNNLLFSISGSRPDDVWAVGSWNDYLAGGYGGKGDRTLALHWDGRRWSRTATPALGERARFSGVSARAGRAWAVGDRGLQPDQRTLVERWDGTRWSVAQSPAGFSLAAVTASPDGAFWAVGASGRHPLVAQC